MKKIKIMLIALMIFFSIITILNPYYAWAKITKTERDGGHTADEIIEEGKSFIDTGKEKADDNDRHTDFIVCENIFDQPNHSRLFFLRIRPITHVRFLPSYSAFHRFLCRWRCQPTVRRESPSR